MENISIVKHENENGSYFIIKVNDKALTFGGGGLILFTKDETIEKVNFLLDNLKVS